MGRAQFVALVLLLGGGILFGAKPDDSDPTTSDKHKKSEAAGYKPMQFSLEFMGMHTLSPTRHWPDVPFGSVRPAGVSWGALEPGKGQYDWHSLDTWVQETQRHHVQLDYVFVNVPRWASTRPDEQCIGKKFGCAAPPNMADWEEFVTTLATRYKGKIASYELWNEPNASGFWTGTPKEMAELAAHAYGIIKGIDPAAIVATPAASSTGWPLSHDAWLDEYFKSGGGKYADVIAWHGYAGRNDHPALPPEGLARQIEALRAVLARYQLTDKPIWNTEGGWGKDAQLPDEKEQAAFLVKWYLINFSNGVARAYWYQWDNSEWGTLWREGSGITPAGKAAQQVAGWLAGSMPVSPCGATGTSGLWTCDLKKGNVIFRVAWSTSGQAPYQDVASLASITEVGGEKQAPPGGTISVGLMPVLLEIKAAK
jgi:Glycosyl hydrolases family 39